ncbi:MAG: cytochrome c maturation protein CcmE [Candidatus Thalassarchaeaceae archaeon]|jgi:cytochrome c-type biogenesis protein CcmE|nr:cytochrome c maturation protein CcmE [Candidatus Thalassarchaeaceae archaeon]MDP7042687.1 cytochrome c maturation protein CcmE [Candidatus Thalassarchaeaceae archaeon]
MALSRRTRLIIIGLFAVAALALVLAGNEPNVQYSVDEVMNSPTDYDEGNVHLRGTVGPNSYDSTNRTFLLQGSNHNLTIDASGVAIPPAFEEGRVVAIKGELNQVDGIWTMSADEIITGCPSKYESEST